MYLFITMSRQHYHALQNTNYDVLSTYRHFSNYLINQLESVFSMEIGKTYKY